MAMGVQISAEAQAARAGPALHPGNGPDSGSVVPARYAGADDQLGGGALVQREGAAHFVPARHEPVAQRRGVQSVLWQQQDILRPDAGSGQPASTRAISMDA